MANNILLTTDVAIKKDVVVTMAWIIFSFLFRGEKDFSVSTDFPKGRPESAGVCARRTIPSHAVPGECRSVSLLPGGAHRFMNLDPTGSFFVPFTRQIFSPTCLQKKQM